MSRSFLLGIAIAASLICSAWSSRALAEESFEQARPEYQMQFPRDFGSHPTFQTEWWYYTGQLVRPGKDLYRDGPDSGFQL
ncbi:MAG: carotenoid 1,2-hydratase, partial [Deltaproteobacteria bacterium]|nr:carotenoid 1,2-hydratase [Deltaproteobacteria bacterium]